MAEQQRSIKVLLVEDDLALAEMLSAYLSVEGCAVRSCAWGEQAVELALADLPDLVVLDIRLPDIDGFEVCRRLQESHQTRAIPILFLTERRDRVDRLRGLSMGVVDYITKPFDVQELRLRIRNTMDHAEAMKAENAITGLPQSEAVLNTIQQQAVADWGIMVVTLNGLQTFRELYGFVAGDDVLRVACLTVASAARELNGDSFCGHLEEDTLAVILPAQQLAALEARIVERLAGSLEVFYPADNRAPNARTGDRLSLAMGQLTSLQGPFDSVADLKHRLLATRRLIDAEAPG
jgi:DNA-binding response OmpR family regulator